MWKKENKTLYIELLATSATGSDSKTLDLVKEYTNRALLSIEKLSISTEKKLELIKFSKSLMDRKL